MSSTSSTSTNDSSERSVSRNEDKMKRNGDRLERHSSRDKMENRGFRKDEEGHMICSVGDLINNRYKMLDQLGEGTFGKVFHCSDLQDQGRRLAVKVVRAVEKYSSAAKMEIKILQFIKDKDTRKQNRCIEIVDTFVFLGHVCIAFPVYGLSVYEFMKKNKFRPFSMMHVRAISYQLCEAVAFLHNHGLTHTDLKPENLLFVDSAYERFEKEGKGTSFISVVSCAIKVIDFGSAVFDDEHHSRVVCTRHYRPIEVVLELPWDKSCDVWSVGCILFELYTGNTLFQTHSNREHMAMMERILEPIPYRMIVKSKLKRHYFYRGELDWDRHSDRGHYVRRNCFPLFSYRRSKEDLDNELFLLISKMLNFYVHKRITITSALSHRFFDDIDDVLRITKSLQ